MDVRTKLDQLDPDARRDLRARLLQARERSAAGYPLSPAQLGMWLQQQRAPHNTAYNMPLAFCLNGRLPEARETVQHVLSVVVNRHATLRTVFEPGEAAPTQRVLDEVAIDLPLHDIAAEPDWQAAALRASAAQSSRAFDLAAGPPFRFALLRVSDEQHVLVATFHHIAMDGWSIGVFLADFAKAYLARRYGRVIPFDPMPLSYRDHVERLRRDAATAAGEARIAYWERRLDGAPASLNLPAVFVRPPQATFRGAIYGFRIPVDVSQRLLELGARHGATPFMTLLASFYALLSRVCDQADIVLGVSTSNRDAREYRGMVGLFSDVLPMRASVDANSGFVELLGAVRANCLSDYDNAQVSLTTIVERVRPARTNDRGLLFQAGFDFQNTPWPALVGDAITLLPGDAGAAKLDLNFNLSREQDRLLGVFEYDTGLFSEDAVRHIERCYQNLLARIVERPGQPIGRIDLVGPDERRRILDSWNAPRDGTAAGVLELIAQRCRTQPHLPALDEDGSGIDYAALAERSDALGRHLVAGGVARGERVGLYFERGAAFVVALLGVAKAAATYVPLDPALNPSRIDDIVADAGMGTVLTTRALAARWPSSHPLRLLAIDEDAVPAVADLPPPPRADEVAYIVYTSGTSGRPKGVLIGHGALAAFVRGVSPTFALRSDDRVLQFASIGFDTSAEEIFPALAAGACLVFAEAASAGSAQRLLDDCARRGVSVLNLPTALWHAVVDALQPPQAAVLPPSVRLVVIGGEAALAQALARWQDAVGASVRLVNTYGPTETTVSVTAAELGTLPQPLRRRALPIGRPYPGVRAYVLDAHGQLLPPGLYGELHIGGDSVALGYDDAPELTRQRFIDDPFATDAGARMYRTGDYVRWCEDGSLEFAGRRDGQVKIRGHRIELAEVEGALLRHPAVAQAVVVTYEAGGDRCLAAHVVMQPGSGDGIAALREWLRTQLPLSMQPSHWSAPAQLPTTVNGKIDRRALAECTPSSPAAVAGEAPLDPTQALLASLWAQTLGVAQVGAHDNFFELGGHSLLMIRLLSRIRRVFGVDLTLAQAFDAPTVARLARLLAAQHQDGGEIDAPAALPREAGAAQQAFPLSFEQERLWFLYQLDPSSSAYNNPSALRIAGRLDPAALQAALDGLCARHEILRSVFRDDGEGARQVVQASLPVRAVLHDLRELGAAARAAALDALIEADAAQPFDLGRDAPLRVAVARCADDDQVLLFNWHHIVTDAWSLQILVRELAALYADALAGRQSTLAAPRLQFADYAAWQRRRAAGPSFDASLRYWRERLRDLPGPVEFAPRQGAAPARAGRIVRRYGAALRDGLTRVARARDATLFVVGLAAFQWLLARCSGGSDVVVGTPVSGRSHEALESLIGFFINTVAVRTDLAAAQGFADVLDRVRAAALGAFAHQDMPFDRVVRELREGGAGELPFDISFVLENAAEQPRAFGAAQVQPLARGRQDAKFRLSLMVREEPDGLGCEWEYRDGEYDVHWIAQLADRYGRLLEGIAAGVPGLIPMETDDRLETVAAWSRGAATEVPAGCVHERFERQARATPAAPALTFEGRTLSFAALNARANRLAQALRERGVGPDVLVGLCAQRSLDLGVAILAVWKAGGAYVALDPAQPPARLAAMMEDSAALLLLGDAAAVAPFANQVPTLALESIDQLPPQEENPVSGVTASHLAYVIYTSGSTGQPKGVPIEHRQAMNLAMSLQAALSDIGVAHDGRWAWNASFGFDASLQALLAWGHGMHLHLLSADTRRDPALLAAYLREHAIDVLDATPLQIESLLSCSDELPALIIGGEAIGPDLWRRIAALPRAALNVYGPTETTVDATLARVEGERSNLGRPLSNVHCYVVDAEGALQPEGVPGELVIGGAGVGRGYLNRPALTAERFVELAIAGSRERVYRSGDLARWIDGKLDFLGRRDGQVKIRGYRIETEEIAQQLRQLPGVAAAAVIARTDGDAPAFLVGYVVPAAPDDAARVDAWRLALSGVLPDYMVPAHLMTLDALPMNASGKLDRTALPAPQRVDRSVYVAPATATEQALVTIWADLFGIDPAGIGATANFFALGGHSLLLMRMISAIRQVLAVELPLKTLFDAADLRACAALVDIAREAAEMADASLEEMEW